MQAIPVDPRDQRWESGGPSYRVHFWEPAGDGWRSEEWELSQADVDEVLAWASARAGGRSMSVWVAHRDSDGLGLIRLAGIDATAAPEAWPDWAAPR